MQKEFQLAVDIEKKILTPSFEVNTLDLKTIKLKITITKGMTLVDLTDITVRMSIRKPDGNVLFQDCQVVNAKGGQVEIILENQAYVMPGSYTAEIMCFKGSDKVAVTGSFSYRSIRGIMDDKAIESKSEFTAITGMIGNVESLVIDLKKNGTGIDAQARQEVQQAFTQLENKTYQKTCKELGMTQNDTSKALENLNILHQALNDGYKVLVDGLYYLTSSGVRTIASIDIEGGVKNAELRFIQTSGSVFDVIGSNISCRNVAITQEGTNYISLFNVNNLAENPLMLNSFITEYCDFAGRIRYFRWTNSAYINPNEKSYGITNISFKFNEAKNIDVQAHGFIHLSDVPVQYAHLGGNNINNFGKVIYNHGIDNQNPYGSHIAEKCIFLKVEGNRVLNDDDWDASTNEGYHSFVLFEGLKCEYKNNHIEGLHVFDKDIALYDSYLSCKELYYEGNTWKNNVCFFANKTNAVLMKSKSHTSSNSEGTIRIYKGNTFIIEKSYADRFSRPHSELWVDLSFYQDTVEKVVVEGNTVDVHILRMNYYQTVNTYHLLNNNIHANQTKGTVNSLLFSIDKTVPKSEQIARNNTIIIEEPSDYGGNSLMTISAKEDYGVIPDEVIFENNHIIWPNLNYLFYTRSSTKSVINNVTFKRNTIVASRPGTESGKLLVFSFNTVIRKMVFDAEFDIPSPSFKMIPTPRGGHEYMDYNMKLKHYPVTDTRFLGLAEDSVSERLTKSYYNRVFIKCYHSQGIEDFYFDYLHFNNGTDTANSVTFTNASGSSVTQLLDGTKVNNSIPLKLNGSSSKLAIQLANSGTNLGFKLISNIPTDEYCVMEIRIIQSMK